MRTLGTLRESAGWAVPTLLFGLSLLLPGCGSFSGKAPLPKHASIEHLGKPASSTDFAALVQNADVIYFPSDRAGSGARSEPAALLLEALEQSGKPFVIGWDLIDATQQTVLDQLEAASGGLREELIAKLELDGTGRAREHCRTVLREASAPAIRQLALRFPRALAAKFAAAEMLSAEEQKSLPTGFTLPAGGLENYAERLSGSGGSNDRSAAITYRTALMRQEYAAEIIVRHMRIAGTETKLLVFCAPADLEPAQGTPFFVAQKLPVRQLILGREIPRSGGGSLLARANGNLRRRVEVVDRAPVAARD